MGAYTSEKLEARRLRGVLDPLGIYKFTKNAGDVFVDEYADKAVPLYQDRVFSIPPHALGA